MRQLIAVYLSSAYAKLMFRDVRCMRILITFLAHESSLHSIELAVVRCLRHNTWSIAWNFTHHMWRGCFEYGTNILNLKSLRVYVSLCTLTLAHEWSLSTAWTYPQQLCYEESAHKILTKLNQAVLRRALEGKMRWIDSLSLFGFSLSPRILWNRWDNGQPFCCHLVWAMGNNF